ncbi:MAG: RodZ domain-containing protein [Thermodesulfovibrionales bacterium]|jgi:transcriptional regulator with XRE-family HTH domain
MGSILRDRREELGQEIEDIARETRINASYLRAIEMEDYSFFPVEVYGKGYIREYAKFLGVPEESALAPYVQYIRENKKTSPKGQIPAPAGKTSGSSPEAVRTIIRKIQSSQPRKGLKKTLWLIPFIAAAIALYSSIPRVKNEGTLPLLTPPPQETAELKTGVTGGIPSAGPSEAIAMAQKKHNLDITASDKVWVRVVADDAETKEALLNAGDKMNIQADEAFRIVVGNASGVRLSFDGKDIGPLGDKAEVVKIVLPREADAPLATETGQE